MERYTLSTATPIAANAVFLQLGSDIHHFHRFANSFLTYQFDAQVVAKFVLQNPR
jgi:hypothetical protein